jgi:hypothetical protein
MIKRENLDEWFTYHQPTKETTGAYERIRRAGRVLAETILEVTPTSADQTAAIRKVREAVMTANAAVACKGK